jgi:bacillithiol biosynthesis cysteine-adding enzyme BshC
VPSEAEFEAGAGTVRASIELSRLPWIRPLVAAYTTRFSSVAPLFAGDPADPSAWRRIIAEVQRAPRDRAALVDLLQAQLDRRDAPAAARANAGRLLDPSAVAVVTGQQAGLFGGPLYTLLKAVSTIQLARRAERDHGVPVVPIFWVESDDHDWAEVKSATILDEHFARHTIAMPDPEGAGVRPVGALMLDAGVDAAIASLESSLAPSEFTAEVLAALRRCYRAGVGMGTAFAAWIETLLGGEGLVVFESNDPRGKALASGVFTRELESPGRTASLAREGGDLMRSLGHVPQAEPADGGISLFYVDRRRNGQSRTAIKRDGQSFVVGGTRHDDAAMRAEAAAHPDRFSPNVLLRPIVQDALFPTVCYVGGPSELAYQAQLREVYRAFELPAPLLWPRASATILDSAAIRFLDRSGIAFESLQAQDDAALNHLMERLLPAGLDRNLDEVDALAAARLDAVRAAVVGIDPTLGGAIDTTRTRIRDTVETLRAKIVGAAKRKDETLRRQFQRTRALAFPGGQPQERALNVTFFVNRYGLAVGARLIDALPIDGGRHFLLTL